MLSRSAEPSLIGAPQVLPGIISLIWRLSPGPPSPLILGGQLDGPPLRPPLSSRPPRGTFLFIKQPPGRRPRPLPHSPPPEGYERALPIAPSFLGFVFYQKHLDSSKGYHLCSLQDMRFGKFSLSVRGTHIFSPFPGYVLVA